MEMQLSAELEQYTTAHSRLVYGAGLAALPVPDLGALGVDVRNAVGMIVELHDRAAREILRELDAINRGRTPALSREEIAKMSDEQVAEWMRDHLNSGPPAHEVFAWFKEHHQGWLAGRQLTGHFAVAVKLIFFLVRAYHDALCRLLLAVECNQPGPKTSMSTHLGRQDSPVRLAIASALPGYERWFFEWKDRRDTVKYGTDFALQFIGGQLGVIFRTGDGYKPDEAVYLSDLATGLAQTTSLVEFVCDRVVALLTDELRPLVATHAP